MSQLWNIIGQASSDDVFRTDVNAHVTYGDLALKDHQALFDFFRVETPFCLTRWELMEVNRIFALGATDEGPLPEIIQAWDPAPRDENVIATFGLASLDERIRDAIENGTVEQARAALADNAPGLALTLTQVQALRDLLARDAGGATVRQRMEEFEALAWVPAQHWDPFCEPGASFSTGYYHANPRLVYALQLIDPLREYLSSEPQERENERKVQRKIRDMIDAHLSGSS